MNVEIFESAELSDLGKKRKNNEDACLCLPDKGIFCVADGMGGTIGGDLASEAITTNLQQIFAKAGPDKDGKLSVSVGLFTKAINQASKWIKNYADEKNIGQMGSTVVALVFDPAFPSRGLALHAGDSRLYRFRHGKLQLLTADHTAVAELAKKLGRDPASLPARFQNELVRAVGLKESVELERTPVDVLTDDVFLLCSDGLSRMVPDNVIVKVLKNGGRERLALVAQSLINAANERGGKDNVTVVLVRVRDISGLPRAVEVEEDDEAETMAAPESSGEPGTQMLIPPVRADGVRHDDVDTLRGDTPETDRRHTPDTPAPTERPSTDSASTTMAPSSPAPASSAATGQPAQVPPIPPSAPPAPPAVSSQPDIPPAGPIPPAPPQTPTPPDRHTPATPATLQEQHPPSRQGSGKMVWAAMIVIVLIAGGIFMMVGRRAPNTEPPLQTVQTPLQPGPSESPSPGTEKPPPPPPPAPTTGGLVLQSDPAGADVFIGGQSVGKTPFQTNNFPVGQINISLGTATHTGTVVAVIAPGQTVTNTIPLAARTGKVLIASDPPGATVLVDEQPGGSTTPTNLSLTAGPHTLTLKYPDLEDLTATNMVVADQTTLINLPFHYGGLTVLSDPPGAQVLLDGKPLAPTPYKNPIVTPGTKRLQIKLQDYLATNLSVEIASRSNSSVSVALRHPFVKLTLKSNLPGAKATLDNQPSAVLPTTVSVEAFVPHVVVAEYKDQRRTNSAVKPTGDMEIPFTFVEPPPPPPVEQPKPAPPPAGPQRWTNDLGMVFVKLPQLDFWVEATRVSPEQYLKPLDKDLGPEFRGEADGPRCVVGLKFEDAKAYAARLTERATSSDYYPPGFNKGHFAIPTTNQWAMMVQNSSALGISFEKLLHYAEWCRGDSSPGSHSYSALYMEGGNTSIHKRTDATSISIRLVIDQ
jgi:serine/threonine protein phosphatase PrpC